MYTVFNCYAIEISSFQELQRHGYQSVVRGLTCAKSRVLHESEC